MAGGIPREVEEFIRSTIVSIQQLDVLLLVSTDETREWTPEEAGSILKTNADAAGTCLRALAAAGLLTRRGESFRYTPAPEQRDVVVELALVYRTYKTRVIQMVYSRPVDAVSTFADAFRLRRKER